MDFWSNLQIHKWSAAPWILLYVLCLLYMFRNRKKWDVDVKSVLIFVITSTVLYYCPIFAKLMLGSFLPSYLEYERMSWLLFITPICSFTIVRGIFDVKREKRKRLIIMLMIIGLMISDVTLFSRGYKVADNFYKVPDDVIEICDTLISDTDYSDTGVRPNVLVQEDEDRGLVGNWMYYGIRQYTSIPELAKVIISSDTYDENGFSLNNYGVLDYQYFVCHNNRGMREQAEVNGLELLVETNDYCLYKNVKAFTLYFVRHGQTDANVMNIFAGSGTDAMLTLEGKEQTIETGDALSDVSFTNVFTSDLTRAKDTAKNILSENKNYLQEIQINGYLNDIYWGDIEGLTVDEIYQRYPDFNFDSYIGQDSDSGFSSPIGAVSKYKIIYCYKLAFWQMTAQITNGGNALVVGHSAMVWYFQQMFPEQVSEDAGLDNASITILNYDRGRWTLEYLNLSAEEYEELGL